MTPAFTRRRLITIAPAALAAPALLTLPARAQEAASTALPAPAYPLRIGDMEVTAISDGYLVLEPPLFVGIEDGTVAEVLQAAFIDPAMPQRTGVTAHLLRTGGQTVLVDAGTADLFGPTLGRLPQGLATLGVAPEDIDVVLVTHMHPDHIGGLLSGGAAAYPNATLSVSETELAFWTDEGIASRAPEQVKPFFAAAAATAAAYGDRVQPFANDAEVLPGIAAVALPGHTPGHTGYRLASGDASLMIFGDAANHSVVQFAHPDAAFVFDADAEVANATRARLFDMLASDRTLAAGTHMPFPGVGHVARAGDAYAWTPEPWRYE